MPSANPPSAIPIPQFPLWLHAARPKTLWAGVAPVLVGSGLAYGAHGFHLLTALACLVVAGALQIAANFSNDYYDGLRGTDTHGRLGPTRAVAAGLITPAAMWRATWLAIAVATLATLYVGWRVAQPWPAGAPYAAVVAGLLVAAVAGLLLYTGGPWPLAYHGFGEALAFLYFGPFAVAGTFWVQAGYLNAAVLLAGCGPGLLSVAIITVNNLRDIDSDAAAGKITLPVRFGATFARVEYTAAVLLAGAVPVLLWARFGASLWVLPAATVAVSAWPCYRMVWRPDAGAALNGTLGATAKLLLLYSIWLAATCAWGG